MSAGHGPPVPQCLGSGRAARRAGPGAAGWPAAWCA